MAPFPFGFSPIAPLRYCCEKRAFRQGACPPLLVPVSQSKKALFTEILPGMELYEVMRTTFAARDFTNDPVSDDVLVKILDNARFAPSGGNRQGWRVVVVRDLDTKAALGPLIEPTFQRYVAQVQAGEAPWNTINPTALSEAEIAATPIPAQMIHKLTHAPVVLLVFVDLSVVASFDSELDRIGVISGGSIYPFVWNILLAARSEGLGGTLTTFIGGQEPQLKALVGVPEHYAFAAMVPLGKPVKQLTKLSRKPVASFAVKERFDGEPLV
jgi:nitroreductase